MNAAGVISQYEGIANMLHSLTILNLVGHEWPKSACVKDRDSFDFVIVGAGTAGCVIANRLIEQKNVSVLLIEAGGNPPFETELPGLYPHLKKTRFDWNFTSVCDSRTMSSHKRNVAEMTQGKMIGGCGSNNYMGYERGNKYDYDRWAELTNDSCWSWESVFPTFRKNEQLIDKKVLNSPNKRYYGTDGKIKVMKQYFERNEDYFHAFEELGWHHHVDVDPEHPLGFTNVMYNIGDGYRQSTARKFLSPIKDKRKLHVMTYTLATKIIFDKNKRAIGVQVVTKNNKILTVRAKIEVIVSAGAIKSPQLLMLSGIGPKDHLDNKGIKVIIDLPVGQHFQDHVNIHVAYHLKGAKRGSELEDRRRYPFCLFDGYVALNQSQKKPDYEIIGVSFGTPESFLGLCSFFYSFNPEFCDSLLSNKKHTEILFITLTYLYPKSRGEILLASSDPHQYPIIIPGYYSEAEDEINHVKYFLDFNRVLETSYFKKNKAKLVLPDLKHCKGLKKGSPEFWKCYVLGMSDTSFYYVGSCGMGRVLDSRLRVHGIKGLRVADASSFPDTVGAPTQATVIMLAQKCAEFIIHEHLKK